MRSKILMSAAAFALASATASVAGTNLGKNFVLGINVSLMALTFDLTIMSWAAKRKKALGLA